MSVWAEIHIDQADQSQLLLSAQPGHVVTFVVVHIRIQCRVRSSVSIIQHTSLDGALEVESMLQWTCCPVTTNHQAAQPSREQVKLWPNLLPTPLSSMLRCQSGSLQEEELFIPVVFLN